MAGRFYVESDWITDLRNTQDSLKTAEKRLKEQEREQPTSGETMFQTPLLLLPPLAGLTLELSGATVTQGAGSSEVALAWCPSSLLIWRR